MKKLISGILALAVLVSMMTFTLTASAATSPVIASDIMNSLSFEADSIAINSNTALAGTGSGWNGPWVKYISEIGSSETDMTTANNIIVKRGFANDSNGYYFSFGSVAHYYYRGLSNQIKGTEDGVYYISFVMADGKGTVGANITGTNFLFADKATVSIKQSEAKGDFYLKLDDAVGKQMDAQTAYNFLVKVEIDADADDKISVEAVKLGNDFTGTWDLTATKELGTDDIAYIGFSATEYGNACNFRDVVIEKYSSDNIKVLEKMRSAIEDETITGTTIESAIAALDEIGEGSIFDSYVATLKGYIEDNSLEDDYKAVLTSSTVEKDQIIAANSISSIDLEFTHSLDKDEAVVTLTDTDGYEVEINPEFNGNKVNVKLEESLVPNMTYTFSLTNLYDFIGLVVDDVVFTFGTDFIPSVNVLEGSEIESGTVLAWEDVAGVTTTAKLNGEEISNGDALTGKGEAVLELKAVNEEGTERTLTINFTLVEAFAPVASEVKITAEENTLTGSFSFSDKNGDGKGECVLAWYYTDKSGKIIEPIDDAETETYTITEADYNKYIAFEVTPVALTGANNVGTPVLSDPFTAPFNPVATGVGLKGDVRIDETVEIKFNYYDENGDEKGEHIYKWYICDTLTSEPVEIPSTVETNEKSYKVTEEVIGKYFCASITPYSQGVPENGEEYFTKRVLGPVAPVVKNVKITGNARVGNTLSVTYDFFDENLDEEKGSIIEWINTEDDDVIGKGRTLKLTSVLEGETIAVRVKGASIHKPTYSEEYAVSKGVTVSKAGSGGSSGGNGGFTMSGSLSGSEKPKAPEKEETPTSSFNDTASHWAHSEIEALYEKGIISGTGDGNFEPNRSVTRAEIIKMMLSAVNVEASEYTGGFSDVKKENWFAGYVEAALEYGLISKDSSFRPNDAVTRQETAKLLAILMKYEINDDPLEYADAETIAKWAVPYVGAVTVNGLMQGDVNNEFGARGMLTRAEAATVIYRILNK